MARIKIDDIAEARPNDEEIQRVTGGYSPNFRGGVYVAAGDFSEAIDPHSSWSNVETVSFGVFK